jgi:hypothetical protein
MLASLSFEASAKSADKCWMGRAYDQMELKFFGQVEDGKEFAAPNSYNIDTADGLLNIEFERNASFVNRILVVKAPRSILVTVSTAQDGQVVRKSVTSMNMPKGGLITLFDSAGGTIYIQCGTYRDAL